MNRSQLQKAAGISVELAAHWFPYIVAAMKEFGITATIDRAMFIVQVGHEGTRFTQLVESFNYSAAGLNSFVRAERLTQGQTNSLGRRQGKPSLPLERQRATASLVYSRRVGDNGPTDGWFYRERGLTQITGLDNYRDCGNTLRIDLAKKPGLLAQDEYAVRSTAWFHASCGCLCYPGDLARVTQIISGRQNGIDGRRARFLKVEAILVV